MPQVTQIPQFNKLCDVKTDEENGLLSLIFETSDGQYFEISITSDLAAQMLPTILERSPEPKKEPMSFSSKLTRLKTAIDENGNPLLGLFFPSAIPVTVQLTDETMSLIKHAITDLETKVGSNDANKN